MLEITNRAQIVGGHLHGAIIKNRSTCVGEAKRFFLQKYAPMFELGGSRLRVNEHTSHPNDCATRKRRFHTPKYSGCI
jgi:hypothetical protein